MKISPEECGKSETEVKDVKTGGTKIVPMHCGNALECKHCGKQDIDKYKAPIIDAIKNGIELFATVVHRNNWDKIRKQLQRMDSVGQSKLPSSPDEYLLISPLKTDWSVPVSEIDLDEAILQVHRIRKIDDLESYPRRFATGVLKKQKEDVGETVVVEWPEPVFLSATGKPIPVKSIQRIVGKYLALFSPLSEITPDNASHYLKHRARLKAAAVTMLDDKIVLAGFTTSNVTVPVKYLKDWNIIPSADPERAVLKNNDFGKKLLDMTHFGMVPSYDNLDWKLPNWNNYVSEEEELFIEIVKRAGF